MTGWKAKRFWKDATVVQDASGWHVLLDGRPVRTPAKAAMDLPTEEMASAIAGEWAAQGEEIDPLSMPVTRSANSAIDRVATQHREVAEMLAAYAETDLLCHRADGPERLCDLQAEAWDPILDWAAERFGARLVPTTGILPSVQPEPALRRLSSGRGKNEKIRISWRADRRWPGCRRCAAATLDDVKARGSLNCGVTTGLVGFAAPDANGEWEGFDVASAAPLPPPFSAIRRRRIRADHRQDALHRAGLGRDRHAGAEHHLDLLAATST
jgi:hypothetical protein